IREGYTFVWDGDVSNDGYAPEFGLAFYPKRSSMTTKKRAKLLETFETTDDHAMHAIGLAYDQYGKTYFIIKDSYGVRGPYRGLLMMSEDYFKANTICIALHRNALKLIDD
ncbi:MAG: cysteine protease, partial [Bacteroidaceae bacterium]|nr:cysteine protease [Bacteroidaceae bacterium]